MVKHVETGTLSIAYEESGTPDGTPVVLLHGFPYDIHAYDAVVPTLVAAGCRVIVPYLRGFGPTLFLSADTPRSGQQAALAHDLLGLMDGLAMEKAILAGYDWGGRAACIVAALWPERVRGLVSGAVYNIQHLPSANTPQPPEMERQLWYQYYFHGERGREGLRQYRHRSWHSSCGGCGRPTGISIPRPTSKRLPRSTTRTSLRWSSIRTAIVSVW